MGGCTSKEGDSETLNKVEKPWQESLLENRQLQNEEENAEIGNKKYNIKIINIKKYKNEPNMRNLQNEELL